MLHQTPRARRRDANLARILDAAMELVAGGGLEALSMGRLAAAVDYTPGALYRYFPSKDALLARFDHEYCTDLLRRAGGNLSQAARTAGLERKYLYKVLERAGCAPQRAEPDDEP